MQVTTKEAAMLKKFMANDIVNDHGWRDPAACAWTADLCDTKADAAVLGSLLKKGLMNGNGESVRLTDAGRATCETL